jgi:hypothetical protein
MQGVKTNIGTIYPGRTWVRPTGKPDRHLFVGYIPDGAPVLVLNANLYTINWKPNNNSNYRHMPYLRTSVAYFRIENNNKIEKFLVSN